MGGGVFSRGTLAAGGDRTVQDVAARGWMISSATRGGLNRVIGRLASHPISHRTLHYWVGNGRIEWMAATRKRLSFWTKWNCKLQDEMGVNGLGNRRNAERLRHVVAQGAKIETEHA